MKRAFAVMLLLWAVALPPVSLATVQKKPALSAAEIIAKHVEAAGGEEKLSQFKSRIAIGTVKKENETDARMAILSEAPNRVAAVFLFTNYELRFSYDGSTATLRPQLARAYAKFDSKYREMAASGLMFNNISLHNILLQPPEGVKFEAKGTKKLRGREAYVVEVKRPKMDSMRLYFDAENFMWVRTDYGKVEISAEIKPFTNEPVSRGEDDLTVDFYIETSDFRDVDGVKLPFRFEQIVTSPILRQARSGTITGTISEYRHNETIDPQMFK